MIRAGFSLCKNGVDISFFFGMDEHLGSEKRVYIFFFYAKIVP
jgi:hypothetical protein